MADDKKYCVHLTDIPKGDPVAGLDLYKCGISKRDCIARNHDNEYADKITTWEIRAARACPVFGEEGEQKVRFYDHNFTREDINIVKPGDVIFYGDSSLGNYLIVSKVDVEGEEISGQIACRIGVNCVPLEHIVEGSNLEE